MSLHRRFFTGSFISEVPAPVPHAMNTITDTLLIDLWGDTPQPRRSQPQFRRSDVLKHPELTALKVVREGEGRSPDCHMR